MIDKYNRDINYLRISITDRCNLRCAYCMPNGAEFIPMSEILTYEEIIRIVKQAAKLGIKIIKITGGEPLVRKDCASLIKMLKDIDGIEKVTMTTNGLLLAENIDDLIKAGLDAINISIDTLDPLVYKKLTGVDACDKLKALINKLSEYDIKIKLNAVSIDMVNFANKYGLSLDKNYWVDLIEIAKDYKIDVRFIEMMPIGYGKTFKTVNHDIFLNEIKKVYPNIEPDNTIHGYGPAVYYKIKGFKGSIGLISAIHGKFCDKCNRIRLSSTGQIKACLCYRENRDLKSILRSNEDDIDLKIYTALKKAIYEKPIAHIFEKESEITETDNMSKIGG